MKDDFQYLYRASNEKDTLHLAERIANQIFPGMLITLEGELGAGKTRFSQAFAMSMGVKDIVNSPTFTLIKEYNGSSFPLYHMDVYRITLEEAENLGLEEYFYGEGVTLIEWASRITQILPQDRLDIQIDYDAGEQERIIKLVPSGAAYSEICEKLRKDGFLQ